MFYLILSVVCVSGLSKSGKETFFVCRVNPDIKNSTLESVQMITVISSNVCEGGCLYPFYTITLRKVLPKNIEGPRSKHNPGTGISPTLCPGIFLLVNWTSVLVSDVTCMTLMNKHLKTVHFRSVSRLSSLEYTGLLSYDYPIGL